MRVYRLSSVVFSCALSLGAMACSADAGEDGAPGPSGADGVDGKSGVNGVDGVDGANGKNGADGRNGAAPLVATSDEPPGDNCSHGGKRIDTGVDANGNGVLDPSEKGTPTFVCNGASGEVSAGARIRTRHELAGSSCRFGGIAIEVGVDLDADGELDDAEVDAVSTRYICNTLPAWPELPPLPRVTTAYGFALAVNDVDDTARLGFMFGDPAYRAQLASENVLWDGGGVYSGANVFAVYRLQGAGAHTTWRPYQGRFTPQSYAHSELTFDDGNSYYTTSFPSFGGLVSVVRNGGAGTYALTPAFTGRSAHSVAFVDHVLYALIAQRTVGLTLSTFPVARFGELANHWTNEAILEAQATELSSPKLINAGGTLVGAYVMNGGATIRAASDPHAVAQATDFPEIGSCAGATRVDLAWAGDQLYAGCIDADGLLTVKRATLADLAAVAWEDVVTGVTGPVGALDLSAAGATISLAVRQGTALRAYRSVTDAVPSFDAVMPGEFHLQVASEGTVLSVCDLTGEKTLRTFLH